MDLSLDVKDILDITLDLLDKGTAHDLELFFIVAWTVWWNRNQATHDDLGFPPIQTWEIANRTSLDYKDVISTSLPIQPSSISTWKPPPPFSPHGFFKINVNGAALNDNRNSSIGVIIRDNHRSPLAAMSKILPMPYLTEVTEALTLQQGVRLASEMNLSQTIFESDVLSLV